MELVQMLFKVVQLKLMDCIVLMF